MPDKLEVLKQRLKETVSAMVIHSPFSGPIKMALSGIIEQMDENAIRIVSSKLSQFAQELEQAVADL